ncbi:MAG: xanthine dehydrogenase family protein [Anaerolineae bacterium]|nr:xanthine dehydrogenase family protein [Anaerolineae bacterium]
MAEHQIVGQRIPRVDAEAKVRGQAIFGADVQLAHTLTAKMLGSPHPHARIVSIDTSAAEALAGVWAVVTAADIPNAPKYDPASRYHAFLAREFAVFPGQPVAAVAADDAATAKAALDLIRVEYEVLQPVLTIQDALRHDLPAVTHGGQAAAADESATGHTALAEASEDDPTGDRPASPNIAHQRIFEHGDLDAVLAWSDVIVEHTYTVPEVHQGYIEPHSFVAYWDSADHVTVWISTQGAFAARDNIADTLGIPLANITLNSTEIGGGFGGKIEGAFAPIAVLLAKKARRPVKLVLTRTEELVGANPAPATLIHVKTGARKDGTLTGMEAEVYLDAGAFASGWIYYVASVLLRDTYNFAAWRVEAYEVLTNKASITAYRAPGAVNAAFAIESQLDEMARRLNLDPLALRRQNLTRAGDLLTDGSTQGPTGSAAVLDALASHPAWTAEAPPRQGPDGRLYGRGIGMGVWGGAGGPAGALAKLEADGTVRIIIGTVDLTGSFTSMAQIAAEALGIDVDRVVITKASPDIAPFAPMSAGSQTIFAMGPAVKKAAENLRAKLLHYAADDLGVTMSDLTITGDRVVDSSGDSVSLEMLYRIGTGGYGDGPLVGQGTVPSRSPVSGVAAAVAEVAIDPETGQIELTRLTMFQDVGQAINPLAVEGQMQGGAVQSVGMALWEEIMWDEAGQVRNPSLLDYRKATFADVPPIEAVIIEAPGSDGPYGAKLVGEPPIIPPAPAIANAVANALGVRICDLPLTPERVWRAMHR